MLVAVGFVAGAAWGTQGEFIEFIQRTATGALIGGIAGAFAIGGHRRIAPPIITPTVQAR